MQDYAIPMMLHIEEITVEWHENNKTVLEHAVLSTMQIPGARRSWVRYGEGDPFSVGASDNQSVSLILLDRQLQEAVILDGCE